MLSKDVLTLLFAGLSVVFAGLSVLYGILAWRIAKFTLTYMRGRDLELDTRNGWIEIHKAMYKLRAYRELIMLPAKMAALNRPSPIQAADIIKDYTLASQELRGQLDRLNDDPLLVALSSFIEDNLMPAQWQSEVFVTKFDAFGKEVALKARPK